MTTENKYYEPFSSDFILGDDDTAPDEFLSQEEIQQAEDFCEMTETVN